MHEKIRILLTFAAFSESPSGEIRRESASHTALLQKLRSSSAIAAPRPSDCTCKFLIHRDARTNDVYPACTLKTVKKNVKKTFHKNIMLNHVSHSINKSINRASEDEQPSSYLDSGFFL